MAAPIFFHILSWLSVANRIKSVFNAIAPGRLISTVVDALCHCAECKTQPKCDKE